jgi:hypothetical protein
MKLRAIREHIMRDKYNEMAVSAKDAAVMRNANSTVDNIVRNVEKYIDSIIGGSTSKKIVTTIGDAVPNVSMDKNTLKLVTDKILSMYNNLGWKAFAFRKGSSWDPSGMEVTLIGESTINEYNPETGESGLPHKFIIYQMGPGDTQLGALDVNGKFTKRKRDARVFGSRKEAEKFIASNASLVPKTNNKFIVKHLEVVDLEDQNIRWDRDLRTKDDDKEPVYVIATDGGVLNPAGEKTSFEQRYWAKFRSLTDAEKFAKKHEEKFYGRVKIFNIDDPTLHTLIIGKTLDDVGIASRWDYGRARKKHGPGKRIDPFDQHVNAEPEDYVDGKFVGKASRNEGRRQHNANNIRESILGGDKVISDSHTKEDVVTIQDYFDDTHDFTLPHREPKKLLKGKIVVKLKDGHEYMPLRVARDRDTGSFRLYFNVGGRQCALIVEPGTKVCKLRGADRGNDMVPEKAWPAAVPKEPYKEGEPAVTMDGQIAKDK